MSDSDFEREELKLLRVLARKHVPVHILDTEMMRLELSDDDTQKNAGTNKTGLGTTIPKTKSKSRGGRA